MTLAKIRTEVIRVFGAATVELETSDGDQVRVRVLGWPSASCYRTAPMMSALRRFADDHGTTRGGEDEVYLALEEAEAFVAVAD